MFYGNIRVTAVNFHSKPFCGICHKHTYGTQSDYTEFLALYLISCKITLFLFYKLGKTFCSFICLYPVYSTNYITSCKQKSCYYKLLNRIGIGSRCIKYHNSLFCTFIKRNIVYSRTCSGYCKKITAKVQRLHIRTSYKNCVCLI